MANWIELFELLWNFLKEIFGMIVALEEIFGMIVALF